MSKKLVFDTHAVIDTGDWESDVRKEGNFSRERTNELHLLRFLMYCKIKWNQVIVVCDHSISINFFFFIVVLGAVEQ